jgi:hypothetical protein
MRIPSPLLAVFALPLACSSSRTVVVAAPQPQAQRAAPATAATLRVPPGHMPKVGECRVWIPGTPPGRQPRPKSRTCAGIAAGAPPGSWIVYRPSSDRKLVHLRLVDARRAGVVVRVQIFDIYSQRLLREENP